MANKVNKSQESWQLNLPREAQRRISKDRFALTIFLFCCFSVVSQVFVIFATFSKLPPQVPIFYSEPWGDSILAGPLTLGILPIITIIVTFINLMLAEFLFNQKKLLSKMLLTFSFLVAFSALYDVLKIVTLIT